MPRLDRSNGARSPEVRIEGRASHIVASFGFLLKGYREAAGLTQEELAKAAGISVRGLRYIEGGSTRPTPRTLSRLASALSCAPAEEASLVAAVRQGRSRSLTTSVEQVEIGLRR